jgi:hypothetical protein
LSTNCSRPRIQKKLLDGKCINKTKQKKEEEDEAEDKDKRDKSSFVPSIKN